MRVIERDIALQLGAKGFKRDAVTARVVDLTAKLHQRETFSTIGWAVSSLRGRAGRDGRAFCVQEGHSQGLTCRLDQNEANRVAGKWLKIM